MCVYTEVGHTSSIIIVLILKTISDDAEQVASFVLGLSETQKQPRVFGDRLFVNQFSSFSLIN